MARKKCPVCNASPVKRACPVAGEICPRCCGEKRGYEYGCPLTCDYLRQAHEAVAPKVMAELAVAVPNAVAFVRGATAKGIPVGTCCVAIVENATRDPFLEDEHVRCGLEALLREREAWHHPGEVSRSLRVRLLADDLRKAVANVDSGAACMALVHCLYLFKVTAAVEHGSRAMISRLLESAMDFAQAASAGPVAARTQEAAALVVEPSRAVSSSPRLYVLGRG